LFDSASVVQIGAVAEYDGSGIASDKWYDKSGNDLHGTVTSATVENAPSDDDGLVYEEGDWTPLWFPLGGDGSAYSFTYDSTTYGKYRRIGNVVHLWGHLASDNVSFTNNYTLIQISGFPYSASSAGITGFVVYSEDWAGDAPEFIQHATDTRGYIMYGAGGQSYLDDSDFTSGSNDNNNQMTFYITYYV